MHYNKPNFKVVEISNEDIILTSDNWDYKDTIEFEGEIEFV